MLFLPVISAILKNDTTNEKAAPSAKVWWRCVCVYVRPWSGQDRDMRVVKSKQAQKQQNRAIYKKTVLVLVYSFFLDELFSLFVGSGFRNDEEGK